MSSSSKLNSDSIGRYTQAQLKSFVCAKLGEIGDRVHKEPKEMARMLGIPYVSYWDYLKGNRVPPFHVLARLYVLYGIDIREFLPADLSD